MHRFNIDAALKSTKDQGYKVKGQGQICNYLKKNCLGFKSGTDDCIFIKLMLMIHINATLKVTKGQGHKVKGQGQLCRHVKLTVYALNHERLIGSWSNSYIGLTLMQH